MKGTLLGLKRGQEAERDGGGAGEPARAERGGPRSGQGETDAAPASGGGAEAGRSEK